MKRLEETLEELWSEDGAPASTEDGHPDIVSLGEYLDGALETVERDRIEAHLADCTACRRLVAEASGALAEPVPETPAEISRAPSPARRWPLAAGLAAALLALLLWWSLGVGGAAPGPQLADLGVTPSAFQEADAELRTRARAAAEGRLPDPAAFGAFLADGQSTLRTGDAERAPQPLSPRWTAVRSPRPTFRWQTAETPGAGPITAEILLVDAREQVVFAHLASTAEVDETGVAEVPFPPDAPPLTPGGVFAWKVNRQLGGDWISSDYVPFRVLAAEAELALRRRKAALPEGSFLLAVAYLEAGLDDPAAALLARLPTTGAGAETRAALVRELVHRKQLPRELEDRQLDRLLGISEPDAELGAEPP